MRRGLLVVLLSLALITMGLSACSSKGTTAEVKAAEVSFTNAYAIVGNASVVPIEVQFEVTNPSNVTVTLDSLEFALYINDLNIAYLQIPCNYGISAGGQIPVSGVVLVSFGGLVGHAMFGQGLSAGNATMQVLPYWKEMGGSLPAAPLQPLWDSISPAATWKTTGFAYIEGNGQHLTTQFSQTLPNS